MSGRRSLRIRIGLGLLGLFAAASQFQSLRAAIGEYRGLAQPDEVSRNEARFQALRAALPGHGVVGYISDLGATTDPASSEARQSFKRYLLTQYALVPHVVVRNVDAGLVVGDFSASAPDGRVTPAGFVMVKDFGEGVVLYRRLSK